VSPSPKEGSGFWKGARHHPKKFFLLFYLKMEHFVAAFKLNFTDETRTQLQEEAICLILAMPMLISVAYVDLLSMLHSEMNCRISWNIICYLEVLACRCSCIN